MSSVVRSKVSGQSPDGDRHNQHRLTCLTGVRFIAALGVVLFHFGVFAGIPGTAYWSGGQAVGFFFILSGIVLTYCYHDAVQSRSISWSNFMNRRLARIMPVHVFTWLVATVLHLWFGWIAMGERHPVLSWLAGLFCVQVYWPSPGFIGRWNPPAWTVSCELFFYALFPLLLPLISRALRSTRSIIAGIVAIYFCQLGLYLGVGKILTEIFRSGYSVLGYQSAAQMENTALLAFPPLRLGEFLIGVCLGLLIVRGKLRVQGAFKANLLLLISVVVAFLVVWLPGSSPLEAGVQKYLLVPVSVLLLVALVSGATVVTPLLENRLAILLGEASYSLYLLHSFFTPGPHASGLDFLLSIVASIVCAIALHLFLERPARRMWRRVLGGQEAKVSPKVLANT
jgi:peptidoglycan/LPS O-acetylase OafA/YrhL